MLGILVLFVLLTVIAYAKVWRYVFTYKGGITVRWPIYLQFSGVVINGLAIQVARQVYGAGGSSIWVFALLALPLWAAIHLARCRWAFVRRHRGNKAFYAWGDISGRTKKVYGSLMTIWFLLSVIVAILPLLIAAV